MENICPLCGRIRNTTDWDTKIPLDPRILQLQVSQLDKILLSLGSSDEIILTLLEEEEEMCPMCHELLEGIQNETDREELENRLNEQVIELEERMEENMIGKE